MPRCAACHNRPAEWAWQPFGPSDNPRAYAFELLGNHYRGFPVVKVCDTCQDAISTHKQVEFSYRGRRWRLVEDSTEIIEPPPYCGG